MLPVCANSPPQEKPIRFRCSRVLAFALWRLGRRLTPIPPRIPYFALSSLGVGLLCLLCAILPGVALKRLRARASPALEAYWQALHKYDEEKAEAEAAARAAARDAELRKRSYWEFLDGYAFERATAEVLNRHQFNPRVTPGSGDGGIDIEVTKNGLKGVVQYKTHVSCVGPHVVRDLYGVIYHSRATFAQNCV